MSKHTIEELKERQALPLDLKIKLTMTRIRAWVNEYGESGVYISFSGGKDSTVLFDIVRNKLGYKDIPAVFVDVPTQYPELKEFVQTFENVEIIKPKISFVQVCEKYGFPLISKEVSESVQGAKKYLTELRNEIGCVQTDRQTDSISIPITTKELRERGNTVNFPQPPLLMKLLSSRAVGGGTTTSIENSEELASILNERMVNRRGGNNQRLANLLGWRTKSPTEPIKANIPDEDRSNFALVKWKFLLDSPYEISNKCCNAMKKEPAHTYHKKTGRNPITAQMADESRLRLQKWLQNGCNGFNLRIPTSNPMSFWTEQDVLQYIKRENLPICSVYGDVVIDYKAMDELPGQSFLFETGDEPLKTTGCERTGCVLCGFGCHLEKPGEGRFELLKQTHPKYYALLDICKNNGYTYREAIEWLNEHGNLNIKL